MHCKARRSLCCSCQRWDPAILCWTRWSPSSAWSPGWRILCSGGSRTSRSTVWLCLYDVYLAVQLQKEVHQEFCNPLCCAWFPRTFFRLVGHKMFLLPVLVDLVDQFASSILIQPAVLSESSVPFRKAHLSSWIPLSPCKQLVVRGQLHATLSGKTPILSLELVSNCTNVMYSDEVSKYFCMEQSLALSSRMKFPPHNFHLPSGSLSWRTRIVLLVWDFVTRDQPTSNY